MLYRTRWAAATRSGALVLPRPWSAAYSAAMRRQYGAARRVNSVQTSSSSLAVLISGYSSSRQSRRASACMVIWVFFRAASIAAASSPASFLTRVPSVPSGNGRVLERSTHSGRNRL